MIEKNVTDYVVLEASENFHLRKKVLSALARGFKLYGYAIVCPGDDSANRVFCQAMVKYEEDQ